MLTRRELLERGARAGAAALVLPSACAWPPNEEADIWVNDIHSRLNRTRVHRVERPTGVEALQAAVRRAHREDRGISIVGGRHAMGGQQFGSDTILVDTNGMQGIYDFDAEKGEVELGAGTQWPRLISDLLELQRGRETQWGIVQKQTGADRLSLGGALAANAHGRGLTYKPIVQDVEAFTLIDAKGEIRRCSRGENAELFRLAIGGYGLFGAIATVRLRLVPRRRIERVVEITDVAGIANRFADRIAQGYLFGDFQYSTDLGSETLLREGVFSCYRPVKLDARVPEEQRVLSREDWLDFLELSHVNRAEAFRRYSSYYLETNGQVYWSDTHQLSTYIDDYHQKLEGRIGALAGGTEMISEVYVPRDALEDFLEDVRADFVANDVNLIYGTIRLIERDDETFLAWAREPWACVIFNLHTAHDPDSLRTTARHFRRLIDRGRSYDGSYFLTYHRWATREQVLACYPQFPEFLALKSKYDPQERFQSDWYRHYRAMFV
ncbi:MAG: FAD-binding oxidoreductase [Myxococcales bacterium]|nr:FAD-binding oxidoreductase [Myxococcales bacterium]